MLWSMASAMKFVVKSSHPKEATTSASASLARFCFCDVHEVDYSGLALEQQMLSILSSIRSLSTSLVHVNARVT